MNPATASIRYNRVSWFLIFLIVGFGIWNYFTLPRLEDPNFTFRYAVVVTHFPGASPQEVEKLVTDELEDRIREMAELETLESQSKAGVSVIYVEIADKYGDMEPIWQDLRNKVDDVRPELPDAAGRPRVNDEFGRLYGVVLGLSGKQYSHAELKDRAENLKDSLLQISGVAQVELHGDRSERIFLEYSRQRLAELRVSPQRLLEVISSQNAVQPSGSVRHGPERITLDTSGEFTSLEDIRRTSIRLPDGGGVVEVGDIADVRRGYRDPPARIFRFNGEEGVALAVSLSREDNIVEVGERVDRWLGSVRDELPAGMSLEKLLDQPEFVKSSVRDFSLNLLEAFAFVVLVMLLFVGLRTGLIAGLLVPMAMLGCLALMPLFGVKLQIVSIGALIVSLGILVDNGVVISEDILVRISRGEQRGKAAAASVYRLWLPLLTASLTTIFVFLPIPLAQTQTGEYTRSLFLVVTLTLLWSWVLSLTFVPLLSLYLQRPVRGGGKRRGFGPGFYSRYRRVLRFCLRHRYLVTLAAMGIVAVSIWGFRYVPSMFFPPNERTVLTVQFWQPYGTDIEVTEKRAAELTRLIRRSPRTETTLSFLGYGGPRWYLPLKIKQDSPNYAMLVVKCRSLEDLLPLKERIEEVVHSRFPEARASVRRLERGPPVGAPIQIRISGRDISTLYSLRDEVVSRVGDCRGVTSVWDNWGQWSKKVLLDVDQARAKEAGLSSEDIALSLQTQYTGLQVSEYREGEDVVPLVVRAREKTRAHLSRIRDVYVYSPATEQRVPLSQVAEPRLEWQPSNIRRRNGQRTLTVKADIEPGLYGIELLQNEIRPKLESLRQSGEWPEGFRIEYGGEFEKSREANLSILYKVPVAVGLILLVLLMQFNSFRRLLVIGLTVPPMAVGVTCGLLVTQSPFGFMALLGVISLLGILVNNGIVLLDQIDHERSREDGAEALVRAAQRRLRPILMTAATTILGLLPLSLQGGELWRPMANALMFGLGFSTLLTLIWCPVLYSLFFRIRPPGKGQETGAE
ncbi:MAG: efflux RND transporter permease subunit [Desulfohalobiaceae bacterium]|nr:efflux RND transporter permease subunit [Desulfohalobiaceae bacterium]